MKTILTTNLNHKTKKCATLITVTELDVDNPKLHSIGEDVLDDLYNLFTNEESYGDVANALATKAITEVHRWNKISFEGTERKFVFRGFIVNPKAQIWGMFQEVDDTGKCGKWFSARAHIASARDVYVTFDRLEEVYDGDDRMVYASPTSITDVWDDVTNYSTKLRRFIRDYNTKQQNAMRSKLAMAAINYEVTDRDNRILGIIQVRNMLPGEDKRVEVAKK